MYICKNLLVLIINVKQFKVKKNIYHIIYPDNFYGM